MFRGKRQEGPPAKELAMHYRVLGSLSAENHAAFEFHLLETLETTIAEIQSKNLDSEQAVMRILSAVPTAAALANKPDPVADASSSASIAGLDDVRGTVRQGARTAALRPSSFVEPLRPFLHANLEASGPAALSAERAWIWCLEQLVLSAGRHPYDRDVYLAVRRRLNQLKPSTAWSAQRDEGDGPNTALDVADGVGALLRAQGARRKTFKGRKLPLGDNDSFVHYTAFFTDGVVLWQEGEAPDPNATETFEADFHQLVFKLADGTGYYLDYSEGFVETVWLGVGHPDETFIAMGRWLSEHPDEGR